MSFHDDARALMTRLVTAYRAGDAARCAACYAVNGAVYSPYAAPAVGRVAIEALHRNWVTDGQNKTMEVLDAGGEGDTGWCLVRYGEGDGDGDGVSLNVLERGPDGWLIRVSSLNADEPPLA